MAGWHDRLDGHEFEWTHGVGDGQGGLACCDSWVAKSRTRLNNWTELNWNQWWEGNGNPLQYCCLENSLDRGAWWAAIHGVAQNRTWLKWLSSSSKPMMMWPRVVEVKNHSKKHMQWVAISFSRGYSWPTQVSWIVGRFLTNWVTRDAQCLLQHLFNLAKTWKQVKCSSTDEWIKKIGMYICIFFTNGIFCCLVPKSCPTLLWPHGL